MRLRTSLAPPLSASRKPCRFRIQGVEFRVWGVGSGFERIKKSVQFSLSSGASSFCAWVTACLHIACTCVLVCLDCVCVGVCVCMSVSVSLSVCPCVRVSVRACVRACVRARASVRSRAWFHVPERVYVCVCV